MVGLGGAVGVFVDFGSRLVGGSVGDDDCGYVFGSTYFHHQTHIFSSNELSERELRCLAESGNVLPRHHNHVYSEAALGNFWKIDQH